MSEFVAESALDAIEICRRGGRNLGDEDFALFKCPQCKKIYLCDHEADTVYLDAKDLSQREDIAFERFVCPGCSFLFPEFGWLWAGADDLPDPKYGDYAVFWPELLASEWKWSVKHDAVPASYRR
jgi:predicted RNA-binding Zn-ribbon protein involved in translation (DUF1610 family)